MALFLLLRDPQIRKRISTAFTDGRCGFAMMITSNRKQGFGNFDYLLLAHFQLRYPVAGSISRFSRRSSTSSSSRWHQAFPTMW